MFILRNVLSPLQQEFKHRCNGDERGAWFVYTLLAVLLRISLLHTLPTCCDACKRYLDCRLPNAGFTHSWPHQNCLGRAYGLRCGL